MGKCPLAILGNTLKSQSAANCFAADFYPNACTGSSIGSVAYHWPVVTSIRKNICIIEETRNTSFHHHQMKFRYQSVSLSSPISCFYKFIITNITLLQIHHHQYHASSKLYTQIRRINNRRKLRTASHECVCSSQSYTSCACGANNVD